MSVTTIKASEDYADEGLVCVTILISCYIRLHKFMIYTKNQYTNQDVQVVHTIDYYLTRAAEG